MDKKVMFWYPVEQKYVPNIKTFQNALLFKTSSSSSKPSRSLASGQALVLFTRNGIKDTLPFLILHSWLQLAKNLNLTTILKRKDLHSTIKYTNHDMYTTNKNRFSITWWEEFCGFFKKNWHSSNLKPLFKVKNHFSISGNIITSCQRLLYIIKTIC